MQTTSLGLKTYRASPLINYSGLRVFNTCPRLYYETFVTKTYVEPERDYFLYGSLVDCMLTTPDDLLTKYIRVDRTVDVGSTLKFEQQIKELELELVEIREKADAGNKTAIKGVTRREEDIEALKGKLKQVGSMKTLTQVTAAMWDHATETAEAIKRNPSFQQLKWNMFTSQQVFSDEVNSRKGILDYVCFSKPAQQLYSLFRSSQIIYDEFYAKIQELPEENRYGKIWDIKTTALISTFDPSIYKGQLGWYRQIVKDIVGIRCDCGIIAGDKDPSVKRAQDYLLAPALLDEGLRNALEVETLLRNSLNTNYWPGAKEFLGEKQRCFKCSVCSDRPFSTASPLLVSQALVFGK